MIDFLLAQSPLPDPSSPQSVGWIVLTIAAVCVAINQIMGAVDRFKGRKPDVESLEKFATKPELLNLERRFDELERSTLAELRSINRALGRLEGHLSKSNEQHR